jgi:hypothetical protein
MLIIFLADHSSTWWRLNVSINNLETASGCLVYMTGSKGGAIRLMNKGETLKYVSRTNREHDPIVSVTTTGKKGECYLVEYYYSFGIRYLYSMKRVVDSN